MEFRDYAAKEVSGLVERLNAVAAAHVQSEAERVEKEARAAIEALRTELEAAATEKRDLTASLKKVRGQVDALKTEVQTQKERIDAAGTELAAARHEQKQVEAARQAAEAGLKEVEAARQAVEAALKQEAYAKTAVEDDLHEAQRLLEAARVESAGVNEQLTAKSAEAAKLASELATTRTELEALEAEHHTVAAQLKTTEGQRQTLTAQLKSADAQHETLTGQLKASESQRQTVTAQLKAAEVQRQTLAAQLQAVEGQRQSVAAQLDANLARFAALEHTHAETDGERREIQTRIEAMQSDILASTSQPLDRLLTVFQNFTTGATVAEVLTMLVNGLATEFSRVALFSVKGNRLECDQHVGFDPESDISKVAIPLSIDSLLTRAVTSGRVESLEAGKSPGAARPPFGGAPTCALALPVTVPGETLAVVYAEVSESAGADPAIPRLPAKFAEVLLRHAIVMLGRLSTELKAFVELRDYATMLVNEAEYMYTADADAGKKNAELTNRLRDNIECARRIYAQRAAFEGPRAASLLDEQLAVALEAKSATPFGRALAAIAGTADRKGDRARSRAAAEAS